MWAVESGNLAPDVARDLIYYKMAKDFNIPPEAVDRMSKHMVESMLFIEGEVTKKEARKMRERRH